jgi:hypothetical protein
MSQIMLKNNFKKLGLVVATYVIILVSLKICYREAKQPTLQEKVEHTIYFLDDSWKPTERCTATAIAPHAILTTEHCNLTVQGNIGSFINIDLSTRRYKIFNEFFDERDHVIYILDGPAFKNILPEEYMINVKPSHGKVFIYGAASNRSDGKVDNDFVQVSDVDINQGLAYYTIPVFPGDSGSAIFDENGKVVGLVTYRMNTGGSSGFSLAYPKVVFEYIKHIPQL